MSVILSNRNLLNVNLQKSIFKYWEYETGIYNQITEDNKPFKKYILCLFNEKNKEINYNLDNEYEYVSYISSNNELELPQQQNNILLQMKYEEWLKQFFIPMSCISESRDHALCVDTVRFLNGDVLIIPHVVCPDLLNKPINELNLVYLKESFCEKYNLI